MQLTLNPRFHTSPPASKVFKNTVWLEAAFEDQISGGDA